MSKVFIYSIPKESAQSIHEWRNPTSGKKLKATKISGNVKTGIQAEYSPKYGGLANGLSYKKWIEDGKQKLGPNGEELTLQDKMEQKWHQPKGFLTNKAWRQGDSLREADMTYFQKKVIKMNEGCTVLDLTLFDDEMSYYVILDSPKVANSEKEWKEHKWPKASWYIAIENEAEDIKYKKNAALSKAIATLHSEGFTPTLKEKVACILELVNTKSKPSIELVHNLLFNYINVSDTKPGSIIDKYMELVSKIDTADGRIEIDARYTLKSALDNRVIYERQGGYYWPTSDGEITIGETLTEAINFMTNPKKDSLIKKLEGEIKLKNK